jgi:hypothetical protein
MSDSAIIKECLVHYDNRHIQVRRDFYDLCVYDKSLFNKKVNEKGKIIRDEPNQECMAKIVRLLETLTDDARKEWYTKAINARKQGLHIPNEPEEFPIKLTYGAICTLLYNTYGESTVRNSVAVLIQWGYIQWHQATTNSIPRYILNTKRLQDALHQQAQVRLLKITPTQEDDSLAVENTPPAVVFNTLAVENTPPGVENNTNNKYYNKPFNKSLEKEKSVSLREHATPSSSFANGEDDVTVPSHLHAPHPGIHSEHALVDVLSSGEDTHGTTPAQPEAEQPITSTENAKLHRLTSPSETLSEQNVSTDESLARIERETANHPSSSLVVDSPNAEMTHADARNTTNSYSPHSTLTSAIPETVQSDGEEVTLAEKSAQPVGKGTGRGSKKKPKVDLDKVKPLPRPERPSDEMPWNAKKLLAWGDYFRGHTIPFSERANSRYQRAEQSAIALIERNIEEKHFLAVMRFMRGVNLKLEPDLEFRDDWWPTHQLADLWDAEKHFDNMLNKARQTLKNRKQNAQARAGVASATMTPQTRQPENQLKAPEGWTARRTAEGGR